MSLYQLNNPDINTIIDLCDNLIADEELEVYEFGKNRDLVLFIHKDEDFDVSKDKDSFNIVTISTAQNGKWVDDTGDVYVTDGSLYKELKRIYNYKDFVTL